MVAGYGELCGNSFWGGPGTFGRMVDLGFSSHQFFLLFQDQVFLVSGSIFFFLFQDKVLFSFRIKSFPFFCFRIKFSVFLFSQSHVSLGVAVIEKKYNYRGSVGTKWLSSGVVQALKKVLIFIFHLVDCCVSFGSGSACGWKEQYEYFHFI